MRYTESTDGFDISWHVSLRNSVVPPLHSPEWGGGQAGRSGARVGPERRPRMASPRIFVSHSHVDDTFGRRLVADLRARLGEDAVWYDASGGLHGGDEWWTTIRAEITARDVFLVVLSPDALASVWVPREMNIAYFQHVKVGKRLIPVFYRPCEPPADWQLVHGFDFTGSQSYDQALA